MYLKLGNSENFAMGCDKSEAEKRGSPGGAYVNSPVPRGTI